MLSKKQIRKVTQILYNGDYKKCDNFIKGFKGARADLLDLTPIIVLLENEKSKETPLNTAIEIAWNAYKSILKEKKENSVKTN